jgi:hypothetical protein
MNMPAIRLIGVFVVVVAAAACAGPRYPYAPQDGSIEKGATVVGSRVVTTGISEDIRVMVSRVDGRPTAGNRHDWEKPILIESGSRLLQLAAVQGLLTAETAIRVTLEASQAYVVRFREGEATIPPQIWLEHLESATVIGPKVTVLAFGPPR